MASVVAYRTVKGKLHLQEISDDDWQRLGLKLNYWDLSETEDKVALATAQFIEGTKEGKTFIDEYGAITKLFAFQDPHQSGEKHILYGSPESIKQTELMIRFAIIFNPMFAFAFEDFLLENMGPEMRKLIERSPQEEPEDGESG